MGGTGEVVRGRTRADADGSIVSDSHSLVIVCKPSLVFEGWKEGRSWVVEDGGR